MKKIIILIIIVLTIMVCCCNTSQEKYEQTEVSRGAMVEEVVIKGHIYLIFNGRYKGNIIHAEHCPCKTSK